MDQDDEREVTFDLAEILTKSGSFERAIEAWQALLEDAVNQYGEMAPETAQLYYRYGDALLRKAEESDQLFSGDAQDEGDETEDDVTIAFEVLEVARLIYDKGDDNKALALTFLRLGDLNKMNGNLSEALDDYRKCLELRTALFEFTDRRIADVHWCLAAAWDYWRADERCTDKLNAQKQALHHYSKCADSLSGRAKSLDRADPEFAEVSKILVELNETIQAAPESGLDKLARLGLAGRATTSIGFTSSETQASVVTTLEPKRKASNCEPRGTDDQQLSKKANTAAD